MTAPKQTSFPDLPNYNPEAADGVHVGESPVPGLTLRRILRGHTGAITRIAWSPGGRFLASPPHDQTIRIWDVARGECTAVFEGHSAMIYSAAWSPDGRRLASGSDGESILKDLQALPKDGKAVITFHETTGERDLARTDIAKVIEGQVKALRPGI